ncbi:MAG: hypothetical protein WCQ89_21645 [Verrucomicrobiota bacterium]
MRAVAEVAELALTATALVLREIEAKLPPASPAQTRSQLGSDRPAARG